MSLIYNLEFNGVVNVPLKWKNSRILAGSGSPPSINDSNAQFQVISPDSQRIVWNDIVPSSLSGLSVNDIINSNQFITYNLQRTIKTEITSGVQNAEDFGEPLLHLYLTTNERIIDYDIQNLSWLNDPCNIADYSYVLNGQTPSVDTKFADIIQPPQISNIEKVTSITAVPWNQCNQCRVVNFGCVNQDIDNFTLIMTMVIKFQISCIGTNLEMGFCPAYCQTQANLDFCYTPYSNYCLNTNNSDNTPNIFTSSACQNFFSDYIPIKGPQKEIDNILTATCSKKFPGFEDLRMSQNRAEIELCACHLDPSIYDTLRSQIIEQFPGFSAVDENERCLFPECASTVFTTVDIGNKCLLPNCINISSINNNGTINGPVTINQNNTACVNASQGKPPPAPNPNPNPPNSNPSLWHKYWIWIILGVGIFIILIIVILIIIAADTNKKK